MWEASYGKEPFDVRLTAIRLIRSWKIITMCTLLGTILLTGIYCAKNILFRGDVQYSAESTYRVDYSVADTEVGLVVINATTWNTYVHTDEFLNTVLFHLNEEADFDPNQLNKEILSSFIVGNLESDWRVPTTEVVTTNAILSTVIARAVEKTMTDDFPQGIREIETVRVLTPAGEAREVIPDVRVFRAVVLALVISLFFTIVFWLIKETSDDSIWLPSTIRYRYGLPVVGTLKTPQIHQNLKYLFENTKSVAVCPVQENVDVTGIAEALSDCCEEEEKHFYAVPSLHLCPEICEKLREADGVLLAIDAGRHAGKQTEYLLELLRQQDCNLTAAILCDADEKLICWYYGFGILKEDNREDDGR